MLFSSEKKVFSIQTAISNVGYLRSFLRGVVPSPFIEMEEQKKFQRGVAPSPFVIR